MLGSFDIRKLPAIKEFETRYSAYMRAVLQGEPLPDDTYIPIDQLRELISANAGSQLVWDGSAIPAYASNSGDYSLVRQVATSNGCLQIVFNVIALWMANQELDYSVRYQELDSPLKISLNDVQSRSDSTHYPIRLLVEDIGMESLTFEAEVIQVIDSDYGIHRYISSELGLNKHWTAEEKRKVFPWKVGSIVAVFRKADKVVTSLGSLIYSQYLGEITHINDKDGSVSIRSLKINGTLEDSMVDFLQIDADARHLYPDLLEYPVPSNAVEVFDLDFVGINYHFDKEPNLLTEVSSSTKANELALANITHDGDIVTIAFSETDLVYWVLKQRDYDFDEALYLQEHGLEFQNMSWNRIGEYPNPETIARLTELCSVSVETNDDIAPDIFSLFSHLVDFTPKAPRVSVNEETSVD